MINLTSLYTKINAYTNPIEHIVKHKFTLS